MTAPVNLLAPTPPGVTPETLAGPLAEANTVVVDATMDFSAALEALLAVLNVPLLNPGGAAPQEATAPQGDPVLPELLPPQLVLTPTLPLPALEMPAGTPASLNPQEEKTEKAQDGADTQAALAVAMMGVPPPQVIELGGAAESAPAEGPASALSHPAETLALQESTETPLNAAPPPNFSPAESQSLSGPDAAPLSMPVPEAVPTPEAFSPPLKTKPSEAESLPLENLSLNQVVYDKPENAILSTLPLDTPPSLPQATAVEMGSSLESQPKSVPSARSITSSSEKAEPQLPAPVLAEGLVDSTEVVTQESRPAPEETPIPPSKEKSSPKQEVSTPQHLSPATAPLAPLIHPVSQGTTSQPKDDMSPRKEIRLEVLETGPKIDGTSSAASSSTGVMAAPAAPTLAASASVDAPTLIRHLAERIDTQWRAGDSRIQLALNPPALGSVKISVETHQDHMSVRFNVEQTNVQQVVQAHLPELKQALSDRGWDVSTLQVSVGGMGVDQGQKDGGQNLPTANNNRIPQEGSMNEITSPETSLSDPYLVDMVA